MMEPRSGPFAALRRIVDAYADIDPGGLKLALALKAVVSIALAAALGVLIAGNAGTFDPATWLGLHAPEPFGAAPLLLALPAGIVALHTFIFVPPARWTTEVRQAATLALVNVALIGMVGFAGPGGWGYGSLPLALLWIVLIVAGLYWRRWGAFAVRLGIAVTVTGMVLMIANPHGALGRLLPVAALAGATVAFAVRFLTLRPSAVGAFQVRRTRFLGEVAARLRGLAEPESAAGDAHGPPRLMPRWVAAQDAMRAATAESPANAERFAAQLTAAYRMILALQVIADAVRQLSPDARRAFFARPDVRAHLDQLLDRLEHPAAIGFVSRPSPVGDFRPLLDTLYTESDTGGAIAPDDLQRLRVAVGLFRLQRSLEDFLQGRSETAVAPPQPGATGRIGPVVDPEGAKRLALQGLVATSITTAMQFGLALDHAYWATLTVALVLWGTVGETVNRTLRRGLGTAIGVAVAIALVPFVGGSMWLEIGLLVPAAVVMLVALPERLLLGSSMVGFVVALGIHVLRDADPWTMFARAYETFIGAGVALAVALVLLPAYASDRVRDEIAGFFRHVRDTFARLRGEDVSGAILCAGLAAELQVLKADMRNLAAERRRLRGVGIEIVQLLALFDAVVELMSLYENSARVLRQRSWPAPIEAAVERLGDELGRAFEALAARSAATGPDTDGDGPVFVRDPDMIGRVAASATSARDAALAMEHVYHGNRLGETLNRVAEALRPFRA